MKSIEEKQDLLETIEGATQEVEKLSADLGVPVNTTEIPAKDPQEAPEAPQPEAPQPEAQPPVL